MTLPQSHQGRLEGLCTGRARIHIGASGEGIERAEAHLIGQAFAPHRHDTYAIGITLAGVQSFRYRGARHHSLPGQCHILHPDELHDGVAGSDAGFAYRMLYIDPARVQAALGGTALPFVRTPVIDARQVPAAFAAEAWDMAADVDDLAGAEIVAAAASFLAAAAGQTGPVPALAAARVLRVRERIAADPTWRPAMVELERLSGLDRWTLARQFRLLFGTSPSRFRTLRQLDRVRRALRDGIPLAAAALDAGFADQSHMSRHFKRAYGITPAAWLSALRNP